MTGSSLRVTFDFGRCSVRLVVAAVVAAVDQLCAEADADVGVLDALEVPIEEMLLALHPHVISSVDVEVDAESLRIDVRLETPPPNAFGEFTDVVEAFFDVIVRSTPPHVALIGPVS